MWQQPAGHQSIRPCVRQYRVLPTERGACLSYHPRPPGTRPLHGAGRHVVEGERGVGDGPRDLIRAAGVKVGRRPGPPQPC